MDNTDLSSTFNPSISFITKKICRLNSFLESLNLVPPSSNTQFVCTKENDGDVMFVEKLKKYDDSSEEELEEDESAVTGELGVEKLVAKSSPSTKDDNHASFDVGYHVYEADSTISPKKQCLGGSNFISSPVTNVTSSGIRDITTISGTAVPNIDFGQPIATLHRSDVVPDTG
ncbi:hypothetical protein Tco_1327224 [Tanacetum coccineum]